MNVICLKEEAFFKLVELTVKKISAKNGQPEFNKWVDEDEAMNLLKIKSKTTLQSLRDNGKIAYSQPMKKVILVSPDWLYSN